MAYGLYNPSITRHKPKFWLAKPNKQVISRLKEIDSTSKLKVEFGKINELNFTIPYYKEQNNKSIINPHIEQIKGKYLLKMEFMDKTEWFVIEKFSKEVSENDSIPVTAYSLQYGLTFKKIYEIEVTSVLAKDVFDDVLSNTGWSVGIVDPILSSKYRSFNFSNTSVLDCLYQIAETYNGILQFDTNNQTISLYSEETVSKFEGLVISDKNYLSSATDEKNASEVVTRLYPIGSEAITINSVNPSGTSYLEDFSYFLYPFERDKITKKTIRSSDYFTDELSHAILDFQELVESKKDELNSHIESRESLEIELTDLKGQLSTTRSLLDQVNDRIDIMKANQEYYSRASSTTSVTVNMREGTHFFQVRSKGGTSSVWVDGVNYSVGAGWTSFKRSFAQDKKINYKVDSTTNRVEFYVARIPQSENSLTNAELRDRYNSFVLIDKVLQEEGTIKQKETSIETVQQNLTSLRDQIAISSNFNDELIEERNRYVYEEYWIEENHVNSKELYEDALEQFKTINRPSTTMNVDIINFLTMVGESRNWMKMNIGSKLRVKYSKLGIESESILVGIDYDFEENSIYLSISDTKDLLTDEEKLVRMIYSSSSSTNYLALKKFIYDNAVQKSNAVEQLLNETWDANLRRIVAGVNESVDIGKRGIVIKNPNFPDDILVVQAGVLAISNDGGMSFKNAITTNGVIAERLIGQVIIGERLWIEDDNGIVTIRGDQIEIKDNFSEPRVTLGQYESGRYGIKVENGALEIVGGLKKDQMSKEALLALEGTLSTMIGSFTTAIIEFKAIVDPIYSNGTVDETDRAMIVRGIENLNIEKSLLDSKHSTLMNNPNLPINDKDKLRIVKESLGTLIGYDLAHERLIDNINNAITDNVLTPTENTNKQTAFTNYLDALSRLAQVEEEATNNLHNGKLRELREDLRLTAPLPSSLRLDENGFTAYQADTSKFARMDYRGLYVQGGAIDIRTASAANRGVIFNGNGLKGYDSSGRTTFDLSSNGDFTLYGGTFKSTNSDSTLWIEGGDIRMSITSNGRNLNLNALGMTGFNSSGEILFQANRTWVTSGILGTNTRNVYLAAGDDPDNITGEARVVHIGGIPGGGEITDYNYLPVRASGFYGNFLENSAGSSGINLYLRPRNGGEVRITGANTLDIYYPLRAGRIHASAFTTTSTSLWMGTDSAMHVVNKGYTFGDVDDPIYRNIFAANIWGSAFITQSTHAYVGADGELRVVNKGLSGIYREVRALGVHANFVETNSATSALHFYVRPQSGGEAQVTRAGTTSTFMPIRASGFIEASSEEYKEDITPWNYDALTVIMNEVQTYQYKFIGDTENIYRRGLIVERETPAEFINGKGINTYEMNTWKIRAIQQLGQKDLDKEARISKLELEVEELKAQLQTS